MKALTIKEPWATLIINGYKKYEFRSWKTNYRGKILIHAGKTTDKEACSRVRDYNLFFNNGNIIGECTITDCILVNEEFDKKLRQSNPIVYKNNHVGMYAWKLEKVIKYDKVIATKGKLGLWDYQK